MAECEDSCNDQYQPPYELEDDSSGLLLSSSSSSSADDDVVVFDFEQLVKICGEVGMSTQMVEGVIIQMITNHFSCPDDYLYPQLSGKKWSVDPDQRTLHIRPLNTFLSKSEAGQIPAIVYTNMGQRKTRITIGDQFYQTAKNPEVEGFVQAWTGSHNFACIGQTDGEAELLASEFVEWMTSFAPRIIRDLPFHDFQVVQSGRPQAFEQLGGRVGVALSLQYSYLWAWELVPEAPALSAASLSLNK